MSIESRSVEHKTHEILRTFELKVPNSQMDHFSLMHSWFVFHGVSIGSLYNKRGIFLEFSCSFQPFSVFNGGQSFCVCLDGIRFGALNSLSQKRKYLDTLGRHLHIKEMEDWYSVSKS